LAIAVSVSKSAVDRLGERLKRPPISEQDLRSLDEYRRSFGAAYLKVIAAIRALGIATTGRPSKSTTSIVAKLLRESARLSQIQDIAGCRVVVEHVDDQDRVVRQLLSTFERTIAVDRRQRPSHGYRAVHVIAHVDDRRIEIQVRTRLQHLWAEASEKLSDIAGAELKYGVGPEKMLNLLSTASSHIGNCEDARLSLREVEQQIGSRAELSGRLESLKATLTSGLISLIAVAEQLSRYKK